MSHITKVRTQLKDGLILRKSLRKLGYLIKERGSGDNGETKDLEFMARKGRTRIGFKRSRENLDVYEMLADWEEMKEHREDVCNAIYQIYSQEKIVNLARVKGYSPIRNRVNGNGQIEIVLRKVV
jgi:hypothetical protein